MAIWIVLPILTLLMFDLVLIACCPIIFANEQMAIPAILYSLMMNIVLLIYVGIVRKKDKACI